MALRVVKHEGSPERHVLIAMITDVAVLGPIADRWKSGLFASKWSNLVASWCVTHYRSHHRAPGAAIENYYRDWADVGGRDKELIAAIESLLMSLSGEYERPQSRQSDHLLDVAGKLFEKVHLTDLAQRITANIERGDVEKARDLVERSRKIEIGLGAGIDVLTDRTALQAAFAYRGDSLIQLPGGYGGFFGSMLRRGSFISFLGKEKVGKCLGGNTPILMADGRLLQIADVVATQESGPVVCYNENTMRMESAPITGHWDNGTLSCLELTTRTGRRITATVGHPFLTPGGWRKTGSLQAGDYIAVGKRLNYFGGIAIPESELKFLAYMLAEGGCTQNRITFTNADPVLVDDFHRCCDELGIGYHRVGLTSGLKRTKSIREKYPCALANVSSKTKLLPDAIFSCPRGQIATFLRVFFSCDGWSLKSNGTVGLTLANEPMLRQISHLLLRFGIVHDLKYDPVTRKADGRVFPAWTISIRGADHINLFIDEINFLSMKRRDRVTKRGGKSFLDKLPWRVAERIYDELREEFSQIDAPASLGSGRGKHVRPDHAFRGFVGQVWKMTVRSIIDSKQPAMMRTFDKVANTSTGRKYLGSDVLWDEIVSIRDVGEQRVYDITVDGHHNFVAGDVVSHNSYFLQDIAWRMVEAGLNVAYFEMGDDPQEDTMLRFAIRATGMPYHETGRVERIEIPVSIETNGDKEPEYITRWEDYDTLTYDDAARVFDELTGDQGSRFKLSSHAAGTLSVSGAESILERWGREEWHPDAVFFDYLDVAAPESRTGDKFEQVNDTWMRARGLSQRLHAAVITATQCNREGFEARLLKREHVGGFHMKLAYVTLMVGINQTQREKDRGLYRLNPVAGRGLKFPESRCLWCGSCLAIGQPVALSLF